MTLKVNPNGSIFLPRFIFKPNDRIAFIHERGTLILKKLNSPKISKIAEKSPQKPLSLKAIVKEIHLFRKERKA